MARRLDELSADELRAIVADYENRITWNTDCGEHARLLDAMYAEYVRRERAEAEVERLRAALVDAAEEIEHWGSYAGDYFAKKWDLAGAIRQAREAAECHG